MLKLAPVALATFLSLASADALAASDVLSFRFQCDSTNELRDGSLQIDLDPLSWTVESTFPANCMVRLSTQVLFNIGGNTFDSRLELSHIEFDKLSGVCEVRSWEQARTDELEFSGHGKSVVTRFPLEFSLIMPDKTNPRFLHGWFQRDGGTCYFQTY